MHARHVFARTLITLSVLLAGTMTVRAQTSDFCQTFASRYDFIGWQAPPLSGGGTWTCQPGGSALRFIAAGNAYTAALRKTPEAANMEVLLNDLTPFSPDGSTEDGISVLFHWRDPVYPSGCCDPIH